MSFQITQFLVKYRYISLAVAFLLALLSWFQSRSLQFDRSIENMFTSDSDLLASYHQLKRTFGGNEIVLAVYQDNGLFDQSGAGIRRLRSISQQLADIDGVKAVLSIDQPLGDAIIDDNILSQRTRRLFQGYTHGQDGSTVCVACMLFPEQETSADRTNTIESIRTVMNQLPDDLGSGYITGEPVLVADGFRFVEADGRRLGIWSAFLLSVTIIACFRSIRWVMIPVLVVQASILLTNGVLSTLGLQLSMVSSMLTAVVMVIAVATMVHVMVRYVEARNNGLEKLDAVQHVAQFLAVPVFWACATDAAGFLALTGSDVGPVRDFGVMMAIGSFMVLMSVALLVPACATVGSWDTDPHFPWGDRQLNHQLKRSISAVERAPKRILFAILVLAGVCLGGLTRLHIETDFTKNFRADSEIVQGYQLVEDKLGGAGVCDVILPAPETLTYAYLNSVTQLTAKIDVLIAEYLSQEKSLSTRTLSLAEAVITIADLESKPKFARDGLAKIGLGLMKTRMPEFYHAMHATDPVDGQNYFRIMLRVSEQQSAEQKQRFIAQLDQVVSDHMAASSFRANQEPKVTGYFVLLTQLIDSVLKDQWTTFGIAILSITVLMSLAFRSLRFAVIAMVPNTLPILVVMGLMGWTRVLLVPSLKINIGAAMIAAVSLGLSIDSSIHYVISFQRALRKFADVKLALEQVQQNVGRAMVLSTLSLIIGFGSLAISEFIPTIYFGVLVSLAMIGGMLGNLIILPVLLYLFAQPRSVEPPTTTAQ